MVTQRRVNLNQSDGLKLDNLVEAAMTFGGMDNGQDYQTPERLAEVIPVVIENMLPGGYHYDGETGTIWVDEGFTDGKGLWRQPEPVMDLPNTEGMDLSGVNWLGVVAIAAVTSPLFERPLSVEPGHGPRVVLGWGLG